MTTADAGFFCGKGKSLVYVSIWESHHSRCWIFLLQRKISCVCFHLVDMTEDRMVHCQLDLFGTNIP